MSRHGALQQKAGDDQAVDFIGAFKDAIDAGIAVSALGRILFDETVAAVNLDGFVHHVVDHLRAPDFEDRTFDRVLLDRLARFFGGIGAGLVHFVERDVHHAHGAIDQRLADIDQRRHVRHLFAHQAEVGDHLAERLALLGISNGILQREPRAAHAHRAQLEASHVQDVESDDVALADFTQQIFHRNLAVVEDQRAGGRAADAHLVFFRADRKSRESLLHQKRS